MKNVIIGQYIPGDSWIHKMDSRAKIIALVFLIIAVTFLINNLTVMIGLLGATFLVLFSSKISLMRFIKGLRPVLYLLFFTFIFQIFLNKGGAKIVDLQVGVNLVDVFIALAILLLYIFTKKYIKFKFLYFLITFFTIFIVFYLVNFSLEFWNFKVDIYEDGLYQSAFLLVRIFILISLSTLLTLTTKPNDLNNGLDELMKPLSKLKIPTSEISMMISITLRYIPTLFEEANKIIKAQASRGVDFNEGSFREKITQIVSLLIPMFIISFKRAEDLSDAMGARGYIPGAPRTKLYEMKFHFIDYMAIIISLLLDLGLVYVLIMGY